MRFRVGDKIRAKLVPDVEYLVLEVKESGKLKIKTIDRYSESMIHFIYDDVDPNLMTTVLSDLIKRFS